MKRVHSDIMPLESASGTSQIATPRVLKTDSTPELPDVLNSDLSGPWKAKNKYDKIHPLVLDAFEKCWPKIVGNIKRDIASGVPLERAVENALGSLKRTGKLQVGLNDQQVEKFFKPDIQRAADILGGTASSNEAVSLLTREDSGFATDPGRDSRYANLPQPNQDTVGNYTGYTGYNASPQERISAARNGETVKSFMETKPLYLTPEDLASRGRLYVLSDGVGGDTMPGDIASNFVVQNTLVNYYNPNFRPDLTDPVARMRAVLDKVNSELIRETGGESAATLSALIVFDGEVWTFNVGDSRIYRIDGNGKITLLTTDQNWGNEMVARGIRTTEEIKTNPGAKVLWSCMGGVGEHFRIDVRQFRVHSGDKYAQISDGLLEVLSEENICDCVNKRKSPQAAAQSLVETANSKRTFLDGTPITGRRDNITAQVIKFPLSV